MGIFTLFMTETCPQTKKIIFLLSVIEDYQIKTEEAFQLFRPLLKITELSPLSEEKESWKSGICDDLEEGEIKIKLNNQYHGLLSELIAKLLFDKKSLANISKDLYFTFWNLKLPICIHQTICINYTLK